MRLFRGRVRNAAMGRSNLFRIPKRRKGEKGNYYALTLHKRIESFSENEPSIGEKLIALKWLGNAALHQGDVSRDDLLAGFEILENLLVELFDQQPARLKALARDLTKKHGHRSPRKKKGT